MSCLRAAQGRLRCGLREIAGGSGLVVDGHDLGLRAGEQTDFDGAGWRQKAANNPASPSRIVSRRTRRLRPSIAAIALRAAKPGWKYIPEPPAAAIHSSRTMCWRQWQSRWLRHLRQGQEHSFRQRCAERGHETGRPVEAGEIAGNERAADLRAPVS